MNQQSGEEVETFCNKRNHQNYALSITIKIDETIKHLNQQHLYITTIDNNDSKLNITRICAIKMAHTYNVTFVKVFII